MLTLTSNTPPDEAIFFSKGKQDLLAFKQDSWVRFVILSFASPDQLCTLFVVVGPRVRGQKVDHGQPQAIFSHSKGDRQSVL